MKKNNLDNVTKADVKRAMNEVFSRPSQLVNLINKNARRGGVLAGVCKLLVSRYGSFSEKEVLSLSQFVIIDGKLCKVVKRAACGMDAIHICKGKQIARLSGWILMPVACNYNNIVECLESYRKVSAHYESIFASAEKAHDRKVAKVLELETRLAKVQNELDNARRAI